MQRFYLQDTLNTCLAHRKSDRRLTVPVTLYQVVPKLEGVDELLNIPLDEECLQKLLSGDEPDDVAMVRPHMLLYPL